MFLVITGPGGCGKTQFCLRLIEAARALGHSCGGVLTRRSTADAAASRRLEDVAGGFSLVIPPDAGSTSSLVRNAHAWANDVLRAASQSADLVVVDELGGLELEEGQGLSAALEPQARPARAVYVVREGLAEALLARMGTPRATVLHLAAGDPPSRVDEALALLFPAFPEETAASGTSAGH